jgi:outer membrane protein TolC
MRRIKIIVAFFMFGRVNAQSTIDSVLKTVEANNKSIQSSTKYWKAKGEEFKSGLTPYDPQVDYDYMYGSPIGAGNQRDFAITQRFDFPTVYSRKKSLSGAQIRQTEIQQQVQRQEILLQAKLTSLELIYLNKKASELNRRLAHTSDLVNDYQKKMAQGDAIVLDINKAKLQLLNIRNDIALNNNLIQTTTTKLIEINGGIPLMVADTSYPISVDVPEFIIIDSIIEANDPVLKIYQHDIEIMRRQLLVQKALVLPKIETGYHSQGILGQSYKGVHAGITIPLWENKNKVKAAQANLDFANANAETQVIGHRLENKVYYDKMVGRLNALQEYKQMLSSITNTDLLNKALRLGQITMIQYFYEENFYYSSFDKYLQLELEYQQAVANLYKFQL